MDIAVRELEEMLGVGVTAMRRIYNAEGFPVKRRSKKKTDWRSSVVSTEEVYRFISHHPHGKTRRYAEPLKAALGVIDEVPFRITVDEFINQEGYLQTMIDPTNLGEVRQLGTAAKDLAIAQQKFRDNAVAQKKLVSTDSVNQFTGAVISSMQEVFSDTFASDLAISVEGKSAEETTYGILFERIRRAKADFLEDINRAVDDLGLVQ